MLPSVMFAGLAARYWSKRGTDGPLQVKKTAVASGSAPPAKEPQPSPKAAAAARQLGLAASTGTDPTMTATESSRLRMRNTDDRRPKRHFDQAFPPSQKKKKPQYARRGAPPEFINQSHFEVMSIHSEDENEDGGADSDSDEPLIESQKRRISTGSGSPNQSVGGQTTAHSAAQAAQIQSLTQQLSDSRAACDKLAQEKKKNIETARKIAWTLNRRLSESRAACDKVKQEKKDVIEASSRIHESLTQQLIDSRAECNKVTQEKNDDAIRLQNNGADLRKRIQGLAQQLGESRAARITAIEERKDVIKDAIRLQKEVDNLKKKLGDKEAAAGYLQSKEETSNQSVATRITELERENKAFSDIIADARKNFGLLSAKSIQLQGEYGKTILELNSAKARCTELEGSNEKLQAEVTSLKQRDERWQELWDKQMAKQDGWQSKLTEIMSEMNAPRGRRGWS